MTLAEHAERAVKHLDTAPSWKDSHEAFEDHFGIAYEDFTDVIEMFSDEEKERYDRIVATDEEAGVLWAIHRARNSGLVEE